MCPILWEGPHSTQPTENGSTPSPGTGSQPSPSDSPLVAALPSIIFVGLPEIWDDWLKEGLATLSVRRRGGFMAVNICMPSYTSLPLATEIFFTPTEKEYVHSVLLPGNGGSTDMEEP
jgi:hypothetical protein